jgi:AcrR family transcriptional regulator
MTMDAISQAHNDGRAELARELDDVFARLLDIVAADVPPDDDPDDHVPVLHLALQREHDGLWRVKFDDGRASPPESIRETPTEALAMLPHFVAIEV